MMIHLPGQPCVASPLCDQDLVLMPHYCRIQEFVSDYAGKHFSSAKAGSWSIDTVAMRTVRLVAGAANPCPFVLMPHASQKEFEEVLIILRARF